MSGVSGSIQSTIEFLILIAVALFFLWIGVYTILYWTVWHMVLVILNG